MALTATHKDIKFHVGDTVRVHHRIVEREKKAGKTKRSVKEEIKERVQPYEGVVISIKGSQENKSFTVRRIGANQIGMERVFPAVSPWIEKIEVTREGKVRRSKLYYLRHRPNINVRKKIVEVSKKKTKKVAPKKQAAPKKVAKAPAKATPKKAPAKKASK